MSAVPNVPLCALRGRGGKLASTSAAVASCGLMACSAGKSAGNTAVTSAPRQAPRVTPPAKAGQPIATARPATGFPRPSELFDNWAAVGLLIALGVIAVLLLRRRG